MSTYDPIVQELEQAQATIVKFQHLLNLRQARVTHHPPGGAMADLTLDYSDGHQTGFHRDAEGHAVLKG